jgi:hypothetical protein
MKKVEFGNDYQFGHCHFFARYLIKVFRELLPDLDIKYHLVMSERLDDNDEVIDEVLVHAYLRVEDMLIDSEGVHSIHVASLREKDWADREKNLTPEGYDFETWEDEYDDIPEIFFNQFCSTKKLKQDVIDFLKRDDVQEVIQRYL